MDRWRELFFLKRQIYSRKTFGKQHTPIRRTERKMVHFTGVHHWPAPAAAGLFSCNGSADWQARGRSGVSVTPTHPTTSPLRVYSSDLAFCLNTAGPSTARMGGGGAGVHPQPRSGPVETSSLEIIEQRRSKGGLWNRELRPSTGAHEELNVCRVGRLKTLKKNRWPDFSTSSEKV